MNERQEFLNLGFGAAHGQSKICEWQCTHLASNDISKLLSSVRLQINVDQVRFMEINLQTYESMELLQNILQENKLGGICLHDNKSIICILNGREIRAGIGSDRLSELAMMHDKVEYGLEEINNNHKQNW